MVAPTEPLPKSKMRGQVASVSRFTHAATVAVVRPFTTPAGRLTKSLLPSRSTALAILPEVDHSGPLTSVPPQLSPVASAAAVPELSSNFRCVTPSAAMVRIVAASSA